jgi:alpha-1,6-mannosyltransferase
VLIRGLAGAVLVALGGLVVSVLPPSTPILSIDALQSMRDSETGRMIGLTIVMIGIGMLGEAWLSLCRQVARLDGERATEALPLVYKAAIFWCAPLLLAPPLFSRDGWSYAALSMMQQQGFSPYRSGPGVLTGPIIEAVDPRWLATVTPYGPLPLALGDIASHVTTAPWGLVIAHRIFGLIGLALLAWAVPRLAGWTGMNPALATAIVIASPLMLANGVGGLHNDLLMVGLMAAALVLGGQRHWVYGAALGGLAAAVKVPGGLVCIGVALASLPVGVTMLGRLRRFAAVGAVAVVSLVGLGLIWKLGLGWVEALTVPGTVNTPLSMPTVVGGFLDKVAGWVGLGLRQSLLLDWTRTIAQFASFVYAAWVALRWKTGSHASALKAVTSIIGVMLLLSPVVHIWYFLWLVPFVAPLRLSRLVTLWVIAVSLILGLVAPLDPSLHGAYEAILVGTLLVSLLIAALLLTDKSRARLERIADADWMLVR